MKYGNKITINCPGHIAHGRTGVLRTILEHENDSQDFLNSKAVIELPGVHQLITIQTKYCVIELTDDQKIEIGDDYIGTCGTIGAAPSYDTYSELWGFEVTSDMIEDALISSETEECSYCGWYVEAHELNENGYCESCQDEEE